MSALLLMLLFVVVPAMFAFSLYLLCTSFRRVEQPLEIPEVPPLDPLVICPVCHLMGPHSIEEVPARPAAPITRFTNADGDAVEVYTWQSAAGTPGHFIRRCAFYPEHHMWSVPLSAREEAS